MAAHILKIILISHLILMLVTPASAEDGSFDRSPDKVMTMQELSEQMQSLQEEISRLRDEAEVRNKLEATMEEQTETEKEILTAAGQDYALSREGALELTYGFTYNYNSTDILESLSPQVDHSSNHNLTNSVIMKYALRNNLTINGTVPFVYKSDQRSTSNERNATDIGDLSFGCLWQPKPSDGRSPTIIFNSSVVIPSGTSPYKIDVDEALSSGSGFYSISAGASISKSLDPVFVFGSGSVYYPLDATGLSQRRPGPTSSETMLNKVEPGKTLGLSLGMAYALSYTVSLNTSLSYSYSTKYKYRWNNGATSTSGASTAAVLNIGTGWRISPRRTLSTSLGIGLTNSASDFTFSFSVPFDFKL